MRSRRLFGSLPGTRRGEEPQIQGNFDRVTGGMASGWLYCPQCTATSYIRLDAPGWRSPVIVPQVFERSDVPGGAGFWAQFPSAVASGEIRASCAVHRSEPLLGVLPVGSVSQGVGGIGSLDPYAASGWFHPGVAQPGEAALFLELGDRRVPLEPVPRSSGSALADWSVDFGDSIGYAVSSGTRVVLVDPGSPSPIDSQTIRGSQHNTPVGGECSLPSLPAAPGLVDTESSENREGSASAFAALTRAHATTSNEESARQGFDVHALVRMIDAYAGGEATLTLPLETADLVLLSETVPWDADVDPGECSGFRLTLMQRAFASVVNLADSGGPEEYEELLRQFVYWARHVRDGMALLLPDQATWLADRLEKAGRPSPGPLVPASPPWGDDAVHEAEIVRVLRGARVEDATAPAAPTPPVAADPPTEDAVCVAGLVGHPSAVGLNATQSVAALAQVSGHVCTYNLHPAGRTAWSRDLAAPASAHSHRVVLHMPMDKVAETYLCQPRLWNGRGVAGLLLWETEVVPDRLQPSLELVDVAWAASTFVAEAFTRASGARVSVVGHGVSTAHTSSVSRDRLGLGERDFVVHFAFDAHSTAARKNPVACVRAFGRAFPRDPTARLVVKVRNWPYLVGRARAGCRASRAFLRESAADRRVLVLTDEWSRDDTLALIRMSDCYLSLHRSEGFGYTIAEAMGLGVPVVVTGYSGNMDFCSEDTARLVNYELVPVGAGEYFYDSVGRWADPCTADAARHLREVRAEGPSVARTAAARRSIEVDWTIEQLARRYVAGFRSLDQDVPR